MNDQSPNDQVIQILKSQGYTDDQIAKTIGEVATAGATQFYAEAMATFSDEDITAVEKCNTDAEADVMIKQLYRQKTGQDPEQKIQEFMMRFAKGFIEQYEKDKNPQNS